MISLGWNNVLTILAFLISLSVAAYQIKDYRARPANPVITATHEAQFRTKSNDDLPSDRLDAQFELYATIENRGRNTFTLRRVVLEPEIGETVELHSLEYNRKSQHKFEGNTPRENNYTANTTVPADHPEKIEGTVSIETPAGNDELSTTFDHIGRW